ncbi:SDR family oxidoreductase [Nitratireductor sp. CAU 1489]|uniref:SDR family oxidoreductase n=1 Tax=Nitratireductor arenosus TaxID=2682096 RepID=A0A844QA35_9HYPH|nr:SDR family oxidoreductase [Nitratireductor arenosus]MVA96022.1 SDR family oxidoreductase [Nitratireductor arenosus]
MSARTGVLTGAAGGIGRATAERLVKEGWSLVLVDREPSIRNLAASMEVGSGQRVLGVAADITDPATYGGIDAAVAEIGAPLKLLALVAGVLQEVGAIETLAIAEWDRVFNVNLRANMLLMKNFIPALKAADGAAIVTVSSWYGKSGHGFFGAYCASKAGLISLTHTAADELAKDKIRVNTVAPGNVATSMHLDALTEEAQKRDISFEAMKKIEWDKIPLGRAADPSEIADAINFLAGPDSKYITGATIDVNGGCLFS